MTTNGKREWTEQEDEIIRSLFKDHTYSEIATRLNRPKGSVGARILTLGLQKPKKEVVESRIGTIIRPQPGVTIHYAKPPK